MSKYSFFMLSLLMASAVATQWHNEEAQANKLSAPGQRSYQATYMTSYRRGSILQNTEDSPSCKVVVAEGLKTNSFTSDTTNVYICEKEFAKGVCYFSALKKCCPNSMGEPQDIISVGHHKVAVSLYEAEQGFCMSAVDNNREIELCRSNSHGFQPSCVDIKQGRTQIEANAYCGNQCITTGTMGQCQTCQPEYQEPSCCDCKHPFVKDFLGQCRCPEGLVNDNGRCIWNQIGYKCTKAMFGREYSVLATFNYFLPQTLPFNYIAASTCSAACGPKSCVCVTGYAPPDCCRCLFERPNNLYVKVKNGSCGRMCEDNCLKLGAKSCSECKNGFKQPDCCKCMWPKVLVGSECMDCPSGQTNIGGRCQEGCSGNTINFYGRCLSCPRHLTPDSSKTRCVCNAGTRLNYRGLCQVIPNNVEKDLIDAVQELLGRLD